MPYALELHLTPTTSHPIPTHLPHYAHGLFYALLKSIDPTLSTAVHDAPQNPFTLRARAHTTPSSEQHTLILRLSLLDESLFSPIITTLLDTYDAAVAVGEDHYQISKILHTSAGSKDANYTSWPDLLNVRPTHTVDLKFITSTAFSNSSRADAARGKRSNTTPQPEPRLIVNSLLKKWQAFSERPFDETLVTALEEVSTSYLRVQRFDIRTERFDIGKQEFTGFKGRYAIEYVERCESVMQALGILKAFAFYAGVGIKTSYGMGQVRPFTPDPPLGKRSRVRKKTTPT